jgi:hypothetical protein
MGSFRRKGGACYGVIVAPFLAENVIKKAGVELDIRFDGAGVGWQVVA